MFLLADKFTQKHFLTPLKHPKLFGVGVELLVDISTAAWLQHHSSLSLKIKFYHHFVQGFESFAEEDTTDAATSVRPLRPLSLSFAHLHTQTPVRLVT